MSRYDVGTTYTFARVNFTRKDPTTWTYAPYFDPSVHDLIGIEVINALCVSHHLVPSDWRDEKENHGYIFETDDGRVWHNQYPRASYGQTTDTQDRVITFALTDKVFLTYPDDRADYSPAQAAAYEDATRGYTLATSILDTIHDVYKDPRMAYFRTPEFNAYREMVEREIERVSGKTIVTVPLEFTGYDGTREVTEFITRSKLVTAEQRGHMIAAIKNRDLPVVIDSAPFHGDRYEPLDVIKAICPLIPAA